MKKTIKDFDLNGKKVIIRVDFNVPVKNGKILDDTRIKESLETINYAIENNAKVILMSHLGRVKTLEDKQNNSLKIVSERLGELLNKNIIFVPTTKGELLEKSILDMNCKDVLLMENTRFEDIDGKKESSNDESLGKYWASLGDIFINDAFGTAHRSHASNVGIASNIESGVGFLIEKELIELEKVTKNPKRPFTVILGGAKVSDKIGVIENLSEKADYILIGGAMAFTFLYSQGLKIGKSLLDSESVEFAKNIMEKYRSKIILPIDIVAAKDMDENSSSREIFISDIKDDEIGLDIGKKTVEVFSEYLKSSKSIIWNGPLGYTEVNKYTDGTKGICEVLKELDAVKIIGGGDSASAIINLGYKDYMTHISTGGGASLCLLEGKELPGIVVISEK